MKLPAFAYRPAGSADEAVAALAEHLDDAAVLAGGQSLLLDMRYGRARPGVVVDVDPAGDLTGVEVADDSLRLAALTRHAAVERLDLDDPLGRLLSRAAAEPRDSLADALRDGLGLTGTNLACEHGVCGSCTVSVDGVAVRSCLLLAVQCEGCQVRTVEGLAGADGRLSVLQEAFAAEHGLQCGFCTPGFLTLLQQALEDDPELDRDAPPRRGARVQPVPVHRLRRDRADRGTRGPHAAWRE